MQGNDNRLSPEDEKKVSEIISDIISWGVAQSVPVYLDRGKRDQWPLEDNQGGLTRCINFVETLTDDNRLYLIAANRLLEAVEPLVKEDKPKRRLPDVCTY